MRYVIYIYICKIGSKYITIHSETRQAAKLYSRTVPRDRVFCTHHRYPKRDGNKRKEVHFHTL